MPTLLAEHPAALEQIPRSPHLDEAVHMLGTAALREGGDVEPLRELPDGFTYAEPGSIAPAELVALIQSVHKDIPEKEIIDAYCQPEDGVESIEIGVRNVADGQLVGFGRLAADHDRGSGTLEDFVVDQRYRRLGIGKAIIDQRLRLAEELGLWRVSMPGLAKTNTLETYYLQHGFQWVDKTLVKVMNRPK
ncbi:MAG TPA: GNAT family N-acetyltransferase [Candidatus Saccharimonadales bacterium]|nr:GNAT family N-acetyltransferase [Candidatus Saccharimonadales bacterium]